MDELSMDEQQAKREIMALKEICKDSLGKAFNNITYEDKTTTERVALDIALSELIAEKFMENIISMVPETGFCEQVKRNLAVETYVKALTLCLKRKLNEWEEENNAK